MATVEIFRYEAEDEILPPLCIKCGHPAAHFVQKTFRCAPVPFNIPVVEQIFGQQMTAHVPVCEDHRFHWAIYTWVSVGGFATLVVGIVLGMSAVGKQTSASAADELFNGVLVSAVIFGALWLFALLYIHKTRIKAHQMTHDWMELVGVSEAFSDAMEDKRDEEEDETVERKPSPNPDDPEAKKRRSQLIRSLFGGKIQP